jgi:hypothetical protein
VRRTTLNQNTDGLTVLTPQVGVLANRNDQSIRFLHPKTGMEILKTLGSGIWINDQSVGTGDYAVDQGDKSVTLRSSSENDWGILIVKIHVPYDAPLVTIECCLTAIEKTEIESFWHRLLLGDFSPDTSSPCRKTAEDGVHTWLPNLRPDPDFVIGDHVFRSPAIIVEGAASWVALVPDLELWSRYRQRFKMALDYNRSEGHRLIRPEVAYGFCDWDISGHVYYRRTGNKQSLSPGERLRFAYELLLGFPEHCKESVTLPQEKTKLTARPSAGIPTVASYLWRRYGAEEIDKIDPQRIPFEQYATYAHDLALSRWQDIMWKEFILDDQECGGVYFLVFNDHRCAEAKDTYHTLGLWNQAWFCQVRTAYGVMWYGRQRRDSLVYEKALRMISLALAAPQEHGIFPTVYSQSPDGDWNAGRWHYSCNRRPKGHTEYYHTTDCSWTAFWLLRIYRDLLKDDRIMDFCVRYGDFLVNQQEHNGAIPSWVRTGDFTPSEMLRYSPQTSVSAMFLGELYRLSDEPSYLQAATRAIDFVLESIVPDGLWEDFETYFSCSGVWDGKQPDQPDPYTGVFNQNTLGIYWTAEALLIMYQITGDENYIRWGIRILGELSLYQQVHDGAGLLDINAFGGFGVMNTDAEWNDARQSVFAPLYLAYYDETGNREYFERGIAALRASFTLMYIPEHDVVRALWEKTFPFMGEGDYGFMMENFAHNGRNGPIGAACHYDWGPGSAASTAAYVECHYGDVYLDLVYGQIFGIDGVSARIDDRTGEIVIQEKLGIERNITLVLRSQHRMRKQITAMIGAGLVIRLSIDDLSTQVTDTGTTV